MPIILTLRRLRQKDCKFKASLGYTARPCLKNKQAKTSATRTKRALPTACTERQ
jgi:hypothetical protein